MTQDEIIEMAIKSHLVAADYSHPTLLDFANLVAQHEREACIELTDSRCQCAWAIQERGQA